MPYPRRRDISYQFFGKLFVLYPIGKNTSGSMLWWCHCECGEFTVACVSDLIRGKVQSCGCGQVDSVTKHGDKSNPNSPYKSWTGMRYRCNNPDGKDYSRYGGKGIKVCPEWNDYETFKHWAISHGWRKGLSIDRLDASKDYSPENCEWVTVSENSRRKKHVHN
jgi:hypothetical protein